MKRSEFIEGCLRVREKSGWTFIPVFGMWFAFVQCRLFLRLVRAEDERWNPARADLIVGFCASLAGGFANLMLLAVLILYLLRS